MTKYFIFIPNLLSIIRIVLVYPILNNIFLGNYQISILFFIIASITDALDGFLARTMNWQTRLGTILDPVADKLLLSGTIFIFWLNELIPFYIFIIFISRDIAILLGAAIQMMAHGGKILLMTLLQELVYLMMSMFLMQMVHSRMY